MKHRTIAWSLVALACLALGVAAAQAQDLQAEMRGRAAEGARAPKPKDDGAKPGPKPEHHAGAPGLGTGARPPMGDMVPMGPHMHDKMDHRPGMGPHPGWDASVPRGPRGFAMMGDAGIRHPGRQHLTPEQVAKRNEQLARLRAQYGREVLQRNDVKAELGMHAWRIARLERIRTLAVEQKKTQLVAKVDALIKRENERYQRRLERLRSGDAGVVPAPHPSQRRPTESKTGGQP